MKDLKIDRKIIEMTDEKPKQDNSNRDYAVRTAAIDMAIRSNCGKCYDTENREVYEAEEIVKAAKLFEVFIKGEPTAIDAKIKLDELKDKAHEIHGKKEGW